MFFCGKSVTKRRRERERKSERRVSRIFLSAAVRASFPPSNVFFFFGARKRERERGGKIRTDDLDYEMVSSLFRE